MRLPAAAAAALLAAMAPPPPADAPPTGGTIAIRVDGAGDPLTPAVLAATRDALAAKGFTVFDDADHAASMIDVRIERVEVGTTTAKVPRQVRPLLSGGLVVPLSTGRSDVRPLQRVRLELRIRRRGAIVWSGAAVSVRDVDARTGGDRQVATALADALLRNYPARPDGVVGVP